MRNNNNEARREHRIEWVETTASGHRSWLEILLWPNRLSGLLRGFLRPLIFKVELAPLYMYLPCGIIFAMRQCHPASPNLCTFCLVRFCLGKKKGAVTLHIPLYSSWCTDDTQIMRSTVISLNYLSLQPDFPVLCAKFWSLRVMTDNVLRRRFYACRGHWCTTLEKREVQIVSRYLLCSPSMQNIPRYMDMRKVTTSKGVGEQWTSVLSSVSDLHVSLKLI